jgi:uncharacterized protein (TIGR02145 family)
MKISLFVLICLDFGCICKAQTVTDADGNTYQTVTIGTQIWMAENLKTTLYNDGSAITLITDSLSWMDDTIGAYTWFRNDVSNKPVSGALYNWYAVNTGKLCPADWHVPTVDEWTTLQNYLIINGYNYDGTTTGDWATNNKIAKSLAGTNSWNPSDVEGAPGNNDFPTKRNATGFNALAAGYKDFYGSFGFFTSDTLWHPYNGLVGDWWSSSEIVAGATTVWWFEIDANFPNVLRSHNDKYYGLSVRCVMDSASGASGNHYLVIPGKAGFYPNPATDKLYFNDIQGIKNEIIIYNMEGEQVLNKSIDAGPLDISKLPRGIYMVELLVSGNITINKLIKQ